jgi:signal transduction histidine kinase
VRRLQQCVNNGLSNALKFSARGSRVLICAVFEDASFELPKASAVECVPPLAAHAALAFGRTEVEKARLRAAATPAPAQPEASAADVAAFADGSGSGRRGRGALLAMGALAASSHDVARVRLLVTDQGTGIDASELAVLNEGAAFAQVGKGQLQGKGGTGLGLMITRQLLALHSGSQLRISSEGPGKVRARPSATAPRTLARARPPASARESGI